MDLASQIAHRIISIRYANDDGHVSYDEWKRLTSRAWDEARSHGLMGEVERFLMDWNGSWELLKDE